MAIPLKIAVPTQFPSNFLRQVTNDLFTEMGGDFCFIKHPQVTSKKFLAKPFRKKYQVWTRSIDFLLWLHLVKNLPIASVEFIKEKITDVLQNLFLAPKPPKDRWLPVCKAWEFFHQTVIRHQSATKSCLSILSEYFLTLLKIYLAPNPVSQYYLN